MARTKLFVSHSTKAEAARERLQQICTLLEQAGYDVLVDKRFITSGSQWRERIHLALAQCQAALVLFDEQALKSKWVLKEATILAWREALERPKFHLLPVRVGDIATGQFREGNWSPLNLGESQHVRTGVPQEIVDQVVTNVPQGLQELTAFDRLTRLVANELKDVDETLLKEALEQYFGHQQLASGENWKTRYADLLARKLFEEEPGGAGEAKAGALGVAVDILEKLTVDRAVVERVLDLVRPLWVEGDAAATIPVAVKRSAGYRDLALFCLAPFFTEVVAPDYVARGYLGKRLFHVWKVDDASSGDDFTHIRDRMRDAYREIPPPSPLPDEVVDQLVKSLTDPVVVVVPYLVGEADLGRLRAAYPNVTFLMHTSSKAPESAAMPPDCLQITPELLENEDLKAYQAVKRAGQLIQNLP